MKKITYLAKKGIFSVGVNLPVILVIGLILRLISINQSLWLDEATSAFVAKMSLIDIFTRFLPGDFHPPFYYLVLKLWTSFFGFLEVSLRVPSVVFGVATILFVYLIAKRAFDKKVAVIASALSATSGLLIYYSQEARMYSLAALLVCISIYLFIEKKWVWFSVSLLLIGMTDYVSLLIIPVFWIFGRKDFRKLFLSHVPLIIFFGIWFPLFVSQLRAGFSIVGSPWWQILGTVSFKNIALIPVKFILGRISFDNKIIYGMITVFASTLYFGLCTLSILRRPLKGDPFKVVLGWLLLPVILGIVISFKIPSLSYFRFLFCLPAMYILIALGIENTGKYKRLFLVIVIFINLLSTMYYVLNSRFWREDWRLAAKIVGSDEVVFPSDSQKEALIYYGKGSQIEYYKSFSGGPKEVWLSRYVWQVFDPSDSARQKVESLGYNKVTEYNFNGVVIFQYAYRN